MYSMDFEEYLWANGYDESQIDDIYSYMKELKPLPETYFNVLKQLYRDYIFIGGMPEAVNLFIENGTFSKPFNVQKRIYKDYEDDITKYVEGLDSAKVKIFIDTFPHNFLKTIINSKFQKFPMELVQENIKELKNG